MTEIRSWSATRMLDAFELGEITPFEVARLYLEAIETAQHSQDESSLHPVTVVEDAVIEKSKEATTAYSRAKVTSEVIPALLGIAVALDQDHAAEDHPIRRKLEAAGAIIHAQTLSGQKATAIRNPWDQLSPTSGAAAVLASGQAALATSSDTAGGARINAVVSNQVAYKPPLGRIAANTQQAVDWFRSEAVMGHTVEDIAHLYNAVAGLDVTDHTTVPGRGRIPTAFPQGASWFKNRKIAASRTLGQHQIHPKVAEQFDRVLKLLQEAGAELQEVELPWNEQRLNPVAQGHFEHLHSRKVMASMTIRQTLEAEAKLQQELAEAMAGAELLVTPVSGVSGLTMNVNPEATWSDHLTLPFNIASRCPVMATPIGDSAGGGPRTGIQWVGHPFDETVVFRAAAAWQSLSPWDWLAP